MKTTRQIKDCYPYKEYEEKVWYSEDEIIKALEILPCEELKDECLERIGIIRGLEE